MAQFLFHPDPIDGVSLQTNQDRHPSRSHKNRWLWSFMTVKCYRVCYSWKR